MVDISPISLKLLGFQQTPRAALINTNTVTLAFLGNIIHSVTPRIGASYRSRLVNPLLSFPIRVAMFTSNGEVKLF
jgi:hypothetical protein